MSEPRLILLSPRVSTAQLRKAVKRLESERYPARLQVIHQELQRRKGQERLAA